ncbi:hypothetical protein HK097_001246 [Rhizophlyctis rosea]|uniref:GDP/GTP exchange factor Sec2 N-terminal domain-containing protein n=1 Tax=Rhizophlyctis rosea TaxID=64517 RepID=A0AAD5X6V9_9FUNG|nr:hypothetical protein HK097_001246 [Rhizophlyctis rosea]
MESDGFKDVDIDTQPPDATVAHSTHALNPPPPKLLSNPDGQAGPSIVDQSPARMEEEEKEDVGKLQRRVNELESEIKVLQQKMTTQQTDSAETLSKKNDQIDTMRVKLNRYEFAIKEAILFLSKPMLGYEEWLNRGGPDALQDAAEYAAMAVRGAVAAGGGLAPSRGEPTQEGGRSRQASGVPSVDTRKGGATSTPAQMAEKQQAQQGGIDSYSRKVPAGATNLEVQCLECMRLALNYLKNAQASVLGIPIVPGAGRMKRAGQSAPDLLGSLPKLNVELADAPEGHQNGVARDSTDAQQTSSLGEDNTRQSRGRTQSADPRSSATTSTASRIPKSPSIHANADKKAVTTQVLLNAASVHADDDASDIASLHIKDPLSLDSSDSTTTRRCDHCRDLLLQRDNDRETINLLKRDITTLADQLEDERQNGERIQQSKDILDQELEELTAQLFDQANRMVIEEARMRDELESTNKELRGQLTDFTQTMRNREDELRRLRHSLRALEAAKLRSSSMSNILAGSVSPLGSMNNLSDDGRRASLAARASRTGNGGVSPLSYGYTPSSIIVDGVILREFQDHIKESTQLHFPGQAPTTPFMRRSMVEDVEPCLYFSYVLPTGGGLFKSSSSNSTMPSGLRKKLMEHVSKGLLEISTHWNSKDDLGPSFAVAPSIRTSNTNLASPLSGSSMHLNQPSSPLAKQQSSSTPKNKCSICSLTRDCDYRIRYITPRTSSSTSTTPSPQTPSPTTISSSSLPQKLPPHTTTPWEPLCRFCRDRVASCLEFFTFLSHLRTGVIGPGTGGGKQPIVGVGGGSSSTILGMFRHVLWLKRKMAATRVGSCALFESEGMMGIDRRVEVAGEWERLVQLV